MRWWKIKKQFPDIKFYNTTLFYFRLAWIWRSFSALYLVVWLIKPCMHHTSFSFLIISFIRWDIAKPAYYNIELNKRCLIFFMLFNQELQNNFVLLLFDLLFIFNPFHNLNIDIFSICIIVFSNDQLVDLSLPNDFVDVFHAFHSKS